ncbi:hypothetical protein K1W69_19000 [Hoeflea sp. WL0058]|uniref:Uncharacterized protein n=1 Tax=Flavimaribacter sediminis TaxID=2865987 RepID=A0AAE3D2X8_9HYPH|nr:hypothetical protein [Flavimaribacter sediminis]MBW8639291.1 hypothetical protein [Flavimaribacter sediminis]
MTTCAWLDNLVGKPLSGVNYAADMAMIGFGRGPLVERRGKTIQLSEWDLHLQCPWRFVRDGSVILASTDFHYDAATGEPCDRDEVRKSVFYANRNSLLDRLEQTPVTVVSLAKKSAGAFDVIFERELELNVLPTCSQNFHALEEWRLFQPGKDANHFVYPVGSDGE